MRPPPITVRQWLHKHKRALALLLALGLAVYGLLGYLSPASYIDKHYARLTKTRGDIWEHLPTLYKHAKEGRTAAELGTRFGETLAAAAPLLSLHASYAPLGIGEHGGGAAKRKAGHRVGMQLLRRWWVPNKSSIQHALKGSRGHQHGQHGCVLQLLFHAHSSK